MDAVITYVNGLDPVWQESYRRTVNVPVLTKRYRDWGTLKCLLRGVETYMPFIRKVHLVVSSDSQVPDWVDRSNLHVVLHEDIFPAGLLPVFNSGAIEMFLHRIEGLDEEFVYFNDDFFPVSPCKPEDFFENGKAAVKFAHHLFATNPYKKRVKASDAFAREAAGLKPSWVFLRPQHTAAAMLRSVNEDLYARGEKTIVASVAPLRTDHNFNQYLYSDYAFYMGKTVRKKISNKHFSLAVASIGKICSFLASPTTCFACINDVTMPDEKYVECQRMLLEAFDMKLPVKSRFEK